MKVRGLLPWIIFGEYANVILLAQPERVPEVVVSEYSNVRVPAASHLLYSRGFDAVIEKVAKEENTYVIKSVDGRIKGYILPGLRLWQINASKVLDAMKRGEKEAVLVAGDREPSQFTLWMAAERVVRLHAAGIFSALVKNAATKSGIEMKKVGKRVIAYRISIGGVDYVVELPVAEWKACYEGECITTTGVIPSIIKLIDKIVDKETLREAGRVIAEMKRVGKRLLPLALLQSVSTTSFTYIIGKAKVPRHVKEKYKNRVVTLSWRKLSRGVTASVKLDVSRENVLLVLSYLPQTPPAALILNFPPLTIAPLAAAVNESYSTLRRLISDARYKAESRFGAQLGVDIRDYESFKDAGVTYADVKRIILDGYPRVESIMATVEKLERLGKYGDVLSLVYGEVSKADKVVLEYRSSVEIAAEEEEKEKEEEVVERSQPSEAEEVLL